MALGFLTGHGNRVPDYVRSGGFELNDQSPQAQGLVGFWTLHNDAGIDHSGFGTHMTPVSAPPLVATVAGRMGFGLDGSADYFKHEGSIIANVLTALPFSVLGWGIPQVSGGSSQGNLFTTGDTAVSNQFLQLMFYDTGDVGRMQYRRSDGASGTNIVSTSTTYTSGELNHLCGRVNASGHVDLVLNADFGGRGVDTTNTLAFWSGQNRQAIGVLLRAGTANFMTGVPLHVALYNWEIPDALCDHAYSPDTRWDLYYETGKVAYFFVPAVGGVTVPIFDHHYRSMRAA